MDWLRFTSELPQSSGQVVLDCSYSATLVLLAYLVACAASFATLDMAERVQRIEAFASHRPRRQCFGAFLDLRIRQFCELRLKRVNLRDKRTNRFDFAIVGCAKNFFGERSEAQHVFSAGS